jgi:hypothetical protein
MKTGLAIFLLLAAGLTWAVGLPDRGTFSVTIERGDTGQDTLRFGAGILAGDITITQNGEKLVFSHSNGRDKLSIVNWFESLNDVAHRLDTLTLADGAGADRYVVDNTGEVVIELADKGTDTVHVRISATLGATAENLCLGALVKVGAGGTAVNGIWRGAG